MSSLGRPYVPLPTAVTYNVFSRTLNPTHFTEIGCSLGAWGGTRATVSRALAHILVMVETIIFLPCA